MVLTTRQCRFVRSIRASSNPAVHHSVSDTTAAKPNTVPSNAASWNGPPTTPAKDAAAPRVIVQPLGFSHNRPTPPMRLIGAATFVGELGGPLLPIFHARRVRYADPINFTITCNDGTARSRPASPAAAAAPSAARPTTRPTIRGMERRKPNCAPDAVTSVVAPPGVMVATTANSRGAAIELLNINWSARMRSERGQQPRPQRGRRRSRCCRRETPDGVDQRGRCRRYRPVPVDGLCLSQRPC